MAVLTVRNIPDDLYLDLKKKAGKARRSLNNEVIHLIEEGLHSDRPSKEEMLRQADELRQRLAHLSPLTDDLIRQAKEEGRP